MNKSSISSESDRYCYFFHKNIFRYFFQNIRIYFQPGKLNLKAYSKPMKWIKNNF